MKDHVTEPTYSEMGGFCKYCRMEGMCSFLEFSKCSDRSREVYYLKGVIAIMNKNELPKEIQIGSSTIFWENDRRHKPTKATSDRNSFQTPTSGLATEVQDEYECTLHKIAKKSIC